MKKRKQRLFRGNVVHYVTRRYMMLNKKRTLTTWIGIVFMVLLMTCVFVGRQTAVAYLEDAASMKDGRWHYTLEGVTRQQRKEIEQMDDVDAAAASVSFGMTEFPASGSRERPFLIVKAYEAPAFEWNHIQITKGRLPQNAGEIILSEACLADRADIQIGSQIEASFFERYGTGTGKGGTKNTIFPMFGLQVKKGETVLLPQSFPFDMENDSFHIDYKKTGRTGSYLVTGFMETPSFEQEYAAGYTALTLADQSVLEQEEKVNLFVQMGTHEWAMQRFSEMVGMENITPNNYLLAFSGNTTDSTLNRMVNLMTAFFLILILAVSVVLIYNVFNISFRERSRYLGMLSSVGATGRQKRSSVYFEALYLLAAALPAGILAGFGVIWIGMNLIRPYVIQFIYAGRQEIESEVFLTVTGQSLFYVAAASVAAVLVSAFLPARKIGKTGPIINIRGNEETRGRIYKTKKNVRSASRMLAVNSLRRQRRKRRSISLSVILFLTVLLVTAFGTRAVMTIVERRTENSLILEHKLQEGECMLSFLNGYWEEKEDAGQQYEALIKELNSRQQVKQLWEWYTGVFALHVDSSFYSSEYQDAYLDIAKQYLGNEMTEDQIRKQYLEESSFSISVLVMDDESLEKTADLCGADKSILFDNKQTGVLIVNEAQLSTNTLGFEMKKADSWRYYEIEQVSDLKKGETFDVEFYDDQGPVEESFTAAGCVNNQQLKDLMEAGGSEAWLIMSRQSAQRLAQRAGYETLAHMMDQELHIQLDGDSSGLIDQLSRLADQEQSVIFAKWSDTDYRKTMAQAVGGIVNVMLTAFAALSSVICLMNLWNSISGRMIDRRREFAVMKSVGMTRRQIRSMLLAECCGILAEGLAAAVLISSVLIYGIYAVLSSMFGYIAFRPPYLPAFAAAVFTAAAAILITLYSFRKEKAQDLMECIRSESI